MVRKLQIRRRSSLRHVTPRTILAAWTIPPLALLHMATPANPVMVPARLLFPMRIMATHAVQPSPSLLVTAARHQSHRRKPDTHRIVHLRRRARILFHRRPVARRACLHAPVAPDSRLHRMLPLPPMATLTMHPRPLPRLMTPKTPLRVPLALPHAQRFLKRSRRPQRMPRTQTQLPRLRIPAQPLLHPLPFPSQQRRPCEMPSPKQPIDCIEPLLAPALYPHPSLVKLIHRPAPLHQPFAREPLPVVGLQRLRVPAPPLLGYLVAVARRTAQR
jgi:hypothetical protein